MEVCRLSSSYDQIAQTIKAAEAMKVMDLLRVNDFGDTFDRLFCFIYIHSLKILNVFMVLSLFFFLSERFEQPCKAHRGSTTLFFFKVSRNINIDQIYSV